MNNLWTLALIQLGIISRESVIAGQAREWDNEFKDWKMPP